MALDSQVRDLQGRDISPEYLAIQRVRGNTKEQHVSNAFCSFTADNMGEKEVYK